MCNVKKQEKKGRERKKDKPSVLKTGAGSCGRAEEK